MDNEKSRVDSPLDPVSLVYSHPIYRLFSDIQDIDNLDWSMLTNVIRDLGYIVFTMCDKVYAVYDPRHRIIFYLDKNPFPKFRHI